LAKLDKDKGASSLEEAYDFFSSSKNTDQNKHRCFLLNSRSTFDIDSGKLSEPYVRINENERNEYIKNVLSKRKLDYESEEEPKDEELLSLIPKAFNRFETKRKEIGFSSETEVLIKLSSEKIIALSCNGKGYSILPKKEISKYKKYVKLFLDRRLLKWLLKGPKYAYWGTAENGSHIMYDRSPNIYERGLYHSLSFFYS